MFTIYKPTISEKDFIGINENPETSLKEYGFICRNEKSDEYLCFYKTKDGMYDFSHIFESDLNDLVNLKSWVDEEQRNSFLEYCGQTLENFLALPFQHKAFSMMRYFGVDDIMGISIDSFTYGEALEMLETF